MFVTSGASYQLGSIQNLPWQTIFHKFDCPANFETLTTRARMKVVQGRKLMAELSKPFFGGKSYTGGHMSPTRGFSGKHFGYFKHFFYRIQKQTILYLKTLIKSF